jgi:hypothetical protein
VKAGASRGMNSQAVRLALFLSPFSHQRTRGEASPPV